MAPVLIIAEAGVNHNGSIELGKKLIDAAVESGADIVKFQIFSSELLVTNSAPQAEYQVRNLADGGSQFDMLKKLELSHAEFAELDRHAKACGIEFLGTPFDLPSLEFLLTISVKRLKIGSGDLTNAPLLYAAAASGLPLIVSTGMGTFADIESALGVVAAGLQGLPPPRSATERGAALYTAQETGVLAKVSLLHCTTEYPAPLGEVHLRAMDALRDQFQLPVGYSDHTEGITVSLAAAARGAVIIEKHFTIDRNLPGPDHVASLEPKELKAMVDGIRVIEQALGESQKVVVASEAKNIAIARRSLVATRPIKTGEKFSAENLGIKRPGSGISPFRYWEILGKESDRNYEKDTLIDE